MADKYKIIASDRAILAPGTNEASFGWLIQFYDESRLLQSVLVQDKDWQQADKQKVIEQALTKK